MSNYPSSPQNPPGLDISGGFHIGAGISIATEGSHIRVMCATTGTSVLATSSSLGCLIADRYFQRAQLNA